MKKIALIVYHKNAKDLYDKRWLEQFKHSVINQTNKEFDIVETNYGNDDYRIFENSKFDNIAAPSFVYSLNMLLDRCFYDLGYDFVFNSNVDDYFSLDRIEKQLPYLNAGYDIVSSNFALVKNGSIAKYHKFHKLNIAVELANNHNIVAHPAVCYSAAFWKRHRYVPEQQPLEDLMLWQRAIKDSKIIILEDNLLFHRLHDESVCKSDNR